MVIINKKFFRPFLYFMVGFLCIIPPIFGLGFFWIYFPYLPFYLWLFTVFYLLLLLCGIFNLIEGVRNIKAVRENKRFKSSQYINLFSFFLILTLIASILFYFPYLNGKEWNQGPYLSWSDEDSSTTMTITWITNTSEPNPIFKWGESPHDVDRIAKVEGTNYHHTVKLRRLKPDHSYYYQIPGFRNIITEFRTGPKMGNREPFDFLFYGDTRESNPSEPELHHEENVEQMVKDKNARFVLQAGDIANNIEENWLAQWRYNFQVIEPLSKHIPYMTVGGNHDWWHRDKIIGKKYVYINYYAFPKNDPDKDGTSYWFYYGNVFFLVIGYDEEDYAAPATYNSEFVNWVIERLQYAKNSGNFDWIFVMNHIPAFSIKIEDNIMAGNNTRVRYWHPIFMENGVDFVLNGHNHHYERVTMGYSPADIGTHNITYLVSGGGGGGSKLHDCKMETFDSNADPVGNLKYYGRTDYYNVSYHFVKFSVNGKQLTLTAIKDQGEIIETHTFTK